MQTRHEVFGRVDVMVTPDEPITDLWPKERGELARAKVSFNLFTGQVVTITCYVTRPGEPDDDWPRRVRYAEWPTARRGVHPALPDPLVRAAREAFHEAVKSLPSLPAWPVN